jgi:hypothetical protein
MTSKKLFLVVPGLRGTEQKWEPLLSKLKQDPDISEGQHAEWVFWPHGKRPWSFGRAFEPSVEQIRSLFETTRLVSPFDGLLTRNRSSNPPPSSGQSPTNRAAAGTAAGADRRANPKRRVPADGISCVRREARSSDAAKWDRAGYLARPI